MRMPLPPDAPSPRDDALAALFTAARAERPDTSRAEFGFEMRLLARLAAERTGAGGWREFTIWCWRLLPALTVVTLTFSLWTLRPGNTLPVSDPFFTATASPLPDDDELAQWTAFELLAPI